MRTADDALGTVLVPLLLHQVSTQLTCRRLDGRVAICDDARDLPVEVEVGAHPLQVCHHFFFWYGMERV